MKKSAVAKSAALSMANTVKDSIKTRKIAILAADGVDDRSLKTVKDALMKEGAVVEIVAPTVGYITTAGNVKLPVKKSFLTDASVFYDAVYVPGGAASVEAIAGEANAVHFLNEAFKHCKAIAAHDDARALLEVTYFSKKLPSGKKEEQGDEGLIIQSNAGQLATQFIKAIAMHRFWEREKPRKVPA